jgi:heme-degrading monooxygenase HmoA
MAHLIIKHKVKDYNAWQKVFDGAVDIRRAGGEKSYHILHKDNDNNSIVAIFEWDSLENAKKYTSSPELKEAMGKAGVLEQPEIYFLEEYTAGKV